jgi:ketosteroid isomerase-like protein
MSQENVDVVRRVIDAWNRRDIEGILAVTDPEALYVNASTAVEPGTRRGHEGIIAVARMQWDSLPGAVWEIDRLDDRRDEVISVGCVSRSMPGSDARIDQSILQSWRFRHGKVIRLEMLGAGPHFQKALEAAGLSQ